MRPIFCGNFEYDARRSELERLFRKYGKVNRLDMKYGFAFVHMEDERDAQDAIRGLDQIEFGRKCRRLRVEWSKEERGSRRSNLRPSKTLFVINFDSLHTSTSDLERHFDRYGKVLNVRIRRNYAFIQYDVQEDATRALEATNLSKLMDRIISVEYATKEDDNWRDGCSPDRVRDRSPGRRDYSRGRSPSPYRRVRASPSYGRGPSPNQGERASPDYGHRRSSIGYHKSKDNDHHGRSPLRGGRLSSNNKDDEFGPIENIGSLSPKRETSRSPLRGGSFGPYDIDEEELASREKKCILRVRSRSPPRGWKHSANYNDNEPAPRENTHSLSLKRKRSRSPLRGERHSPDDNDDETAPRENSRSLSPERKRNRIQNDSYRSPYPDPRIDARTSRTNYGAVSSEVVGYERF